MTMSIPRLPLAAPFLALALSGPLQASADDAGRVAQAMLDDLQAVSGVPGFGAAIWQNGQIVWTGSTGMRDRATGSPVTADTRFRLASVSKPIAAVAAAKLAEEGRLDLDAPISDLLPWLHNEWRPITARQLASHTAGLPHYQSIDSDRGARHYPTAREAVAVFSDRPLLANPGERYSYSSWGFTLLGALVESASGEHFGTYVTRSITPGLDVGLDETDSADPAVSTAYAFWGGEIHTAPPHDFSYTWGGGGLMASARDLARFGGAMLADRIVSRASFDRMLEPVSLASGALAGQDGYTVGFGWRIGEDSDGRPIAFHNGVTLGARSSLVLWRTEGVAATILSNALWTSSIDHTAEMLAAPFQTVPQGGAQPCPTGASGFAGRFGTAEVSGTAVFTVRDGICRGELRLPKPMTEYFASGPQPGSEVVKIVALSADGALGRGGLVTPFGIYDLRAVDDDRGYSSALSSSRSFTFTLIE